MAAEYYGNGKSNLRWKLAMAGLWISHPVWRWQYRRFPYSLNMIAGAAARMPNSGRG